MASQGPNSAGTGANVATAGVSAWSNVGNIAASDNTYATCFNGGAWSDYLRATNFGFSIPAGATIDGILVEVERKASAGFTLVDSATAQAANTHKLIKAGTAVGSSKSAGAFWSATEAYVSFGSSSDLWGTTWTDSDINNSGFGFQLACTNNTKSGATASVDHVRITVFYTGGGGGGPAFIARSNKVIGQAINRASTY